MGFAPILKNGRIVYNPEPYLEKAYKFDIRHNFYYRKARSIIRRERHTEDSQLVIPSSLRQILYIQKDFKPYEEERYNLHEAFWDFIDVMNEKILPSQSEFIIICNNLMGAMNQEFKDSGFILPYSTHPETLEDILTYYMYAVDFAPMFNKYTDFYYFCMHLLEPWREVAQALSYIEELVINNETYR